MRRKEDGNENLQRALQNPEHPWRRESVATLFEQLQSVQTEMERTKSENTKLRSELALLQATENISVDSRRDSYERMSHNSKMISKKKGVSGVESKKQLTWNSLTDMWSPASDTTVSVTSSLSDPDELEDDTHIEEVSINKSEENDTNNCFTYDYFRSCIMCSNFQGVGPRANSCFDSSSVETYIEDTPEASLYEGARGFR